jgi:uncharacterized protein with FMN-binding domain
MKSSFNETTPKIVGGAVIGFVALAALYFFIYAPINTKNTEQQSQNNSTSKSVSTNSQNSTSTPVASQTPTTTTNASAYKNGSYNASIDYFVPKSDNTITVQMTIDNGTVTAIKTTHNYTDRESDYYISSFDSLIEQEVKGKKLDELSIGRVGGASLTSNAFDDAIATIKNEAKS